MTESERALLLAVGYWAIGECDIGSGHLRRINDAYVEANKAAKPAEPKPSGSITLPPVAPSPEAIRDFERRAGRAVNAKEAEPKPSASTLPQRLRANSYNAPTWNDCDVMREAAHALENKDAEIAAVIRDNDEKMVEIGRLKEQCSIYEKIGLARGREIVRINEALDELRNPDIEAACEKLDFDVCVRLSGASDLIYHGKLTPHSRGVVARAILTREPE